MDCYNVNQPHSGRPHLMLRSSWRTPHGVGGGVLHYFVLFCLFCLTRFFLSFFSLSFFVSLLLFSFFLFWNRKKHEVRWVGWWRGSGKSLEWGGNMIKIIVWNFLIKKWIFKKISHWVPTTTCINLIQIWPTKSIIFLSFFVHISVQKSSVLNCTFF